MQNKTLAISRGCIPYIKELRNIAGSVTASILMQQLDYWFDKTNGNPFYKFKSQCENKHYKSGDSFTEDLGFSIEEFTNAFVKIGVSYKSKTEFENATDKFQGMFYCSYFDRKEGLTFYFRNHELLDNSLNALFTVKRESPFTENGKVHLQKTGKSISPIYITEEYNSRIQQNINTASGFSQNENPISRKNGKIEIKTSEYGKTQILCPCGEELLDETLEPDKYFCSECLSMYSKDEVLKIAGVNENSVVNDSFTTQNPTVKESLIVQKPKKEEEFEQEFVEFYEAYEGKHPSRQQKTAERVLPKWKNACKTRTSIEILRAVQEYAEYMQVATWRKKKGIIEWLNGGLYETDWIQERFQEQSKQQKSTNNNNYGKPKISTTSQVAEMLKSQSQYIKNNIQTNYEQDEYPF